MMGCDRPSLQKRRLVVLAAAALLALDDVSAFAPGGLTLRGSHRPQPLISPAAGRRLASGGLCLRASSGTEDKSKEGNKAKASEVSFSSSKDSGAGFSAVKLTDSNPGDWSSEEKAIEGDIEKGKTSLNQAKALSDADAAMLQKKLSKEIDTAMQKEQEKLLATYDEKTESILNDMRAQRDIIRAETEKLQALSDEIEGGKFWKGKAKKKGSLTLTVATVLAYTFAFASINEVYKGLTEEATFIGALKGVVDALLAVASTYIANKGPQKMLDEENDALQKDEEAKEAARKQKEI